LENRPVKLERAGGASFGTEPKARPLWEGRDSTSLKNGRTKSAARCKGRLTDRLMPAWNFAKAIRQNHLCRHDSGEKEIEIRTAHPVVSTTPECPSLEIMLGDQLFRSLLDAVGAIFLRDRQQPGSDLDLFGVFEEAKNRLNSFSTFETSCCGSNGFRRKSSAPDSSPANRPNWLRMPVSMMIGTEAVAGSRRKLSQTSKPFNPGNIRSRIIKSGDIERVFTRASVPLAAVPMAKPAAFKVKQITSS